MKYLKNYKIYLEDLRIEDTDSKSISMAKERINKIQDQLKEFKSKNSKLETIYKNMDLKGDDLKREVEKIIPPSDTNNGVDRNPFLVSISQVYRLERKIKDLHNTNTNDKLKVDDFQQSLRDVSDDSVKQQTEEKIKNVKNKISDRISKINDIEKEVSEKEKEHKDKMKEIESELKEKIDEISNM